MIKSKLNLLMIVILLFAMAMLTASCINLDNNDNPPTFESLDLVNVSSTYDGSEGSGKVALAVKNDITDSVKITINLKNPKEYTINNIVINQTIIRSSKFEKNSSPTSIVIYFTPKETSGEIDYAISDIYYNQGSMIKPITMSTIPSFTLSIAPTFCLTVDMSNSENSKRILTYPTAKYQSNLSDYLGDGNIEPILTGCLFSGYYTKPDGKGILVDKKDVYYFNHDITLYTHFKPIFIFEVNEDAKQQIIIGLSPESKKLNTITIPDTINGIPIVGIGKNAFVGVQSERITLGANIRTIGSGAFKGLLTKYYDLNKGLETIGDSAFENTSATNINLPSSLTTIGANAFKNCNWSKSASPINMGIGDKPSLFITSNILSIGDNAFYGNKFKNIYIIQNDDINLGIGVFANGNLLEYANLCANINSSGNIDKTTLNGLKDLPKDSFKDCLLLKSVVLGNVITIGDYAFANCESLNSAKIPDSTTTIGEYSFSRCKFETINISKDSNLSKISDYAFFNIQSLTEVTLDCQNLRVIGKAPFYLCGKLVAIKISAITPADFDGDCAQGNSPYLKYYVPSSALTKYREQWKISSSWIDNNLQLQIYSVTNIIDLGNGKKAAIDISPNNDGAILISYFSQDKNITIPDAINGNNVVGIGSYAFNYYLESVTISKFTKTIGDRAFYESRKLISINFNSAPVTTIGKYAFARTALAKFESMDTLNKIEDYAFNDCANLKNIVLLKGSQLSVGKNAFFSCNITTIEMSSPSVKELSSSAFGNNKTLVTVIMRDFDAPPIHNTEVGYTLPFIGANDNLIIYVKDETSKVSFETTTYWKNYKYALIKDYIPPLTTK